MARLPLPPPPLRILRRQVLLRRRRHLLKAVLMTTWSTLPPPVLAFSHHRHSLPAGCYPHQNQTCQSVNPVFTNEKLTFISKQNRLRPSATAQYTRSLIVLFSLKKMVVFKGHTQSKGGWRKWRPLGGEHFSHILFRAFTHHHTELERM